MASTQPKTPRPKPKRKTAKERLEENYPGGPEFLPDKNKNAIADTLALSLRADQRHSDRLVALERKIGQLLKESGQGESAGFKGKKRTSAAGSAASIVTVLDKITAGGGSLLPHSPLAQIAESVTKLGFAAPAGATRIFVFTNLNPQMGIFAVAVDANGDPWSLGNSFPDDDLASATTSYGLIAANSKLSVNRKDNVTSGTVTKRLLSEVPGISSLETNLANSDFMQSMMTESKPADEGIETFVPAAALLPSQMYPVLSGSSLQKGSGMVDHSKRTTPVGVDILGNVSATTLENFEIPLGYRGRIRVTADCQFNSTTTDMVVGLVQAKTAAYGVDTTSVYTVRAQTDHTARSATTSFIFDLSEPYDSTGTPITVTTPVAVTFQLVNGAFEEGEFGVEYLDHDPTQDFIEVFEIESADSGASYQVESKQIISFIETRKIAFQRMNYSKEYVELSEYAAAQNRLLAGGAKVVPRDGDGQAAFLGVLKSVGRKLVGSGLHAIADKVSG